MNKISEFLAISASIIQGTGIGPVSYVVNASDLKAIFLLNKLFKYADDTYLIVLLNRSPFKMNSMRLRAGPILFILYMAGAINIADMLLTPTLTTSRSTITHLNLLARVWWCEC